MREVAREFARCGRRRVPQPRGAGAAGHRALDGKPAAYGLGNFIFHSQNTKVRSFEEVWRSALMTFRFERRRLAALEVAAVALGAPDRHDDPASERDAPRLWTGPAASAYLQRWIERGFVPGPRWHIADGVARLETSAALSSCHLAPKAHP